MVAKMNHVIDAAASLCAKRLQTDRHFAAHAVNASLEILKSSLTF
jgi:hypothetical protein